MRKAVLVALADRANDDGSGVYVSKKRIAAEIERSRRAVQYACDGLIEDGLITPVGKKTGNHGYTVIYQISVANIHLLPDAWSKCANLHTLDEGLGEDKDEAPFSADEVRKENALADFQVRKTGVSSAHGIRKNRPYRTLNKNPSEKNGASRRKSPSDEAALLRWEANRVRASGDYERAADMEARADAMLLEDAQADRKTEH